MLKIHVDILTFLQSNGLTATKDLKFPENEISYLISIGYIKYYSIDYNDRVARCGITAEGRKALISHQEEISKYAKQIEAAKQDKRKSLVFKIIGAVIMYLLGLFTSEIKVIVISIFEHIF